MITKQKWVKSFFSAVTLLPTLAFMIVGCGRTPTPEPTPEPTPTPKPPAFVLEVRPGTEVQAGDSVAIVAKVEPLEKLNLEWSVSGTAEGKLNTETGEQVIYTAGKEGVDNVIAEGTTASGMPVKQTATLTIIGVPTPTAARMMPTDTPRPLTETPAISPEPTEKAECLFEAPIRIPIVGPPVDAEVHITSMEHCAENLPTAAPIPVAGTYSGDLTGKEIWILVYPPNIVYYPQSTNACASTSTPFAGGNWAETIRLGRPGISEAFHIVAVVTDIGSPASEAFHNYLTVGCNTGDYQGIAVIPSGATELDSIIVRTR